MNKYEPITDSPDFVSEPPAVYNSPAVQSPETEEGLNDMADLAWALIERTGTNLFLTGKAGTGKTTFLRRLRRDSAKRMVVVAPTGIAAINAGGVTIHSFFQIEFTNTPSEFRSRKFDRFSKTKMDIIRNFDVLVIDEISMVRADLLDRVDEVLRRHRNPRKPFGGVQLLMIGDLHQLPPVVTEEESVYFNKKYSSPYFFESEALKLAGFQTVELTRVYRQSDPHLVSLLNAIRTNTIKPSELMELNECVGRRFSSKEKYVRVMTHNRSAAHINIIELERLEGPSFCYPAQVEGKFPKTSYPGEENLQLKIGAQVMFIKNDLQNHDWYNGLLAEVIDLSDNHIRVRTVDGREITVRKEEWVNNSYSYDEEKGELIEIREGAFQQYPLRLAWAITVHKSQGMTFDRAVIDVNNAFVHGQTYVALSRCRTIEGISLVSPLTSASVITDPVVDQFITSQTRHTLNSEDIHNLELQYTVALLSELFDFTEIDFFLDDLARLITQLPRQFSELKANTLKAVGRFESEFVTISRKLGPWFPHFATATPGVDAAGKIASGAEYFAEHLGWVKNLLGKMPTSVQNKDTRKRLDTVLNTLRQLLFIKRNLLKEFAVNPFTPERYLRAKSSMQVRFDNEVQQLKLKAGLPESPKKKEMVKDPELEEILRNWRKSIIKRDKRPAFIILPNKAIDSVAAGQPVTMDELLSLRYIGDSTADRYGKEIIEIVKKWKKNRKKTSSKK